MTPASDEQALLHSVALQNAATILQARQRAEHDLLVAKEQLRVSHERVNSILESITDGFVLLDNQWRFTYLNAKAEEIFGPLQKSRGSLIGSSHWDAFPELRGTDVERAYRRAADESQAVELEVFYPSLASWFEMRAYPSREGLTLFFHDVTRRKDAEGLLTAERRVLELIAKGAAPAEVLERIARGVEEHSRDRVLCSVLRVDPTGTQLLRGAAPSLPDTYISAMEGIRIDASAGPFATAARERRTVEMPDIARDPRAADYRELAASHGIAACCSMPIFSSKSEVLGTVAMHYPEPGPPSDRDRRLIAGAARLSSIVLEREGGEAALRDSEERLSATFEQAAVGIAIVDLDGRFQFTNRTLSEILGFPDDELRARSFNDVTHPDDIEETRANVQRLVAGEVQSYSQEKRYLRKDGSVVWSLTSVTLIRDAAGMPKRFIGVVEDINRRKQAEVALRERESELRALVDSIPQLAWMAQPDGEIFWFNRQWFEYTGTTPEQMQHEGWRSLHDPEILPRVVEQWRKSLATGDPFEMEFPLKGADGTFRTFLTRVNPVRDADGNVVRWFGTNTDVEQVKRARDELREETRVLEMLNRTGTTLSSNLDLETLVQSITDAATELTGAAFGAFFYNVIDGSGESFSLYALSGGPREAFAAFPMPRNTGIFGPTFRGEGIVRSTDITRDPRYGHNEPHHGIPDGHPAVRSYLAVPVTSRAGEVLGGMFFGHPESGVFGERAERVVGAIALQAAIAIDKAKLYRAAQDEIERRKHVERELRQSEVTLDAKVADRTAQLAASNAQLIAEADNRERAEGRFRLLVEGVVDYALYMLSPEGVITNWNTGAQRIKGYGSTEIIGQHYSLFFTDGDRAAGRPMAALAKAAAEGKFEAEGWRVRKDGTQFWASVVLDAIRDKDGRLLGFAKITRDITERRDAAIALQRAQEQLAQAQKMEAIGQLTGGIAHDFNNLLQVIIGNLEAVQRRTAGGSDDTRRMIQAAARGAESAATLTNRLLAFSRRQPLNPKPIDVNTLVTGMSDMLHRALGESISIETMLAGGIWRVAADANQLENSLLNLALNARDAMPTGGELTIETVNVFLDAAYAKANTAPAGPHVVISVRDTGTGMDADVVAKAFEPFFTTKDVGKGSGLGLSQVYGFISQSGGHVRIYSEKGEGTTVKLYLPRLVSKEASHEGAVSDDLPQGHLDRLILVVEDDEDVRAHLVSMLHELRYAVLEAADGASALRMLESNPDIDLLFTDVGLPGGMNGRQLADAARLQDPQLLVLFTTGYARHGLVHQGRLEAGIDLLPKPFTYAALANKVHLVFAEALRNGTLRST
ncbi:MAG: PAS domain S-box protein [Betaproteobacteria bacterium]